MRQGDPGIRTAPHQGQPVLRAGEDFSKARGAVVMVHGRGASAESILSLSSLLPTEGIAYVAPQASGSVWYPYSFLSPIEMNEPGLSSGLQAIDDVVAGIVAEGIPIERVALLGFSQGACLALEYAARHPKRYGGIIGFSGGLIGPVLERSRYHGSFDGTEVFLGCSDIDPHIPKQRVEETARVFGEMGSSVTKRLYPNMAHTVNDEEIEIARNMIEKLRINRSLTS